MGIIAYLKKNGLGHTMEVIRDYKIPNLMNRICNRIYKTKPLQDLILIESHNDFDMNGGALYDYLLAQGLNKKYKIVWLLHYPLDRQLPENVDAVPIVGINLKRSKYLAQAKFIFTDGYYFPRSREEQILAYQTHGGFALKRTSGTTHGTCDYDYCWLSSPNIEEYLRSEINLTTRTKTPSVGYPSMDALFTGRCGGVIDRICPQVCKKTIVWFPTFRKGGGYQRNDSEKDQPLGIPLFETEQQLQELNQNLAALDALLVIKIHPKQDLTGLSFDSLTNIRFLTGADVKKLKISNFDLFADADAMISDYSSSIFQFASLDRPIAFEFSDINDYKMLLQDDDFEHYIAGDRIRTREEFIAFIDAVCRGEDPFRSKRHDLVDYLYTYRDGQASKRICDLLKI